jgi:hypothetical protein
MHAPMGGYGNHIRWLCLLDDQFDFAKLKEKNATPSISTLSEKVDFICSDVYSNNRTRDNWIRTEWKFRTEMNAFIYFCHDHELLDLGAKCLMDEKILRVYIDVDPDLCLRRFSTFEPNLNGVKREAVKERHIKNATVLRASGYCVDGNNLFQEVLPKDTYERIISILNLDNHYDEASKVHKRWYKTTINAEKENI